MASPALHSSPPSGPALYRQESIDSSRGPGESGHSAPGALLQDSASGDTLSNIPRPRCLHQTSCRGRYSLGIPPADEAWLCTERAPSGLRPSSQVPAVPYSALLRPQGTAAPHSRTVAPTVWYPSPQAGASRCSRLAARLAASLTSSYDVIYRRSRSVAWERPLAVQPVQSDTIHRLIGTPPPPSSLPSLLYTPSRLSRTEPGRAEPSRAEPRRAEPSRAEPS